MYTDIVIKSKFVYVYTYMYIYKLGFLCAPTSFSDYDNVMLIYHY